jgi:DNA helicase-2/ATP-dependent DNA helicase PcrA
VGEPLSVSFKELNPKQKEIIQDETERLLVVAGPGTGKTEVLIHRIAYLNTQRKVPADKILAVTFSRKAANEMSERLSRFPKLETTTFHVSTLHAESLRILNEIGYSRKFLVADDEARLLIKDAAEDIGFPSNVRALKAMEKKIGLSKANNLFPNEVKEQPLQKLYQRYEELLDFNDAIDLEGLVLKVTRTILSRKAASPYEFRGHLLVDEYQDINQAEYKLVQILAAKASSLFVVGDDDQSIYGWRGADPIIIRSFKEDFNGKIQVLEQSHRCTEHILQGAYAIVSKDPKCIRKPLCSSRGLGSPIHILLSKSWPVEAIWIVGWIKDYLSKSNNKLNDIAILAKAPALADSLAEQLRIARINVVYWRSGGLMSDKDALDILALIRLVADKEDNLALRRCLTPPICQGIGSVAEGKLRRIAEKHQCCLWKVLVNAKKFEELRRWQAPIEEFVAKIKKMENEFSELNPHQIVQFIAKQLDTDQRINIRKLRNFAKSLPENTSLKDFLAEINKNRGVDLAGGGPEPETEKEEEAITIMSMHSAKGLGFGVVFIIGMDNKILPDPEQDECEQRRLCYVAMTRAKRELFLCHSKMRQGPAAKGHSFYKPSRFLIEIPKEHREVIDNEYTK